MKGVGNVQRSDEPVDRLTKLGGAIVKQLEGDPETRDVKAIIMLADASGGGIAISGYDDDEEAIAAVFAYLAAHLQAIGKDLRVYEIGGRRRND